MPLYYQIIKEKEKKSRKIDKSKEKY